MTWRYRPQPYQATGGPTPLDPLLYNPSRLAYQELRAAQRHLQDAARAFQTARAHLAEGKRLARRAEVLQMLEACEALLGPLEKVQQRVEATERDWPPLPLPAPGGR